MLRQLIDRFLADSSGEIIKSAAKTGVIICVVSVGAASFIADQVNAERTALQRMAAYLTGSNENVANARAGIDMTTTGSLARNQQNLRIDPCGEKAGR